MSQDLGGDDSSTAETVMLRTENGAWYELQRVNAAQAAALEQAAAVAGTDDVAGFYVPSSMSGTLWFFTPAGVHKLSLDPGGSSFTHTVGFVPAPPGGFSGVASGG